MSINGTTWYTGTYTDDYWGTVSLGATNTSGRWPLSPVSSYYKLDVNGRGYRYSQLQRVGNGANLYDQLAPSNGWASRYIRGRVSTTSTILYSGDRIIKFRGVNGEISSPISVPKNTTIEYDRRSSRDAVAGYVTCMAGDGAANTGTLTFRGKTEGVWSHWSWKSLNDSGAVVSSETTLLKPFSTSDNTDQTAQFNLAYGYHNPILYANFTIEDNPADTWSPANGNIIVHLLDNDLQELPDSTNVVNSSNWNTFKDGWFAGFQCTSGTKTCDWYKKDEYILPAYLLNVNEATFSVTPASGKRVYTWKLEMADGTLVETYGTGDSAVISGFEAECKIHLYLTSATPNPRILYAGFDDTGDVPDDERVLVDGVLHPVGKDWQADSTTSSVIKSLAPKAWEHQTLGEVRSVLVDDVETELVNVSGTAFTVESDSIPYSTKTVKFKQVGSDTDGILTLNLVIDAAEGIVSDLGLSVEVRQKKKLDDKNEINDLITTVTDKGEIEIGYYSGDVPLVITATPTYGGQTASDFTLRMISDDPDDDDVVATHEGTLTATGTTRTLTIYLTQIVNIGGISSLDINLTRDTTVGTQIKSTPGTGLTTVTTRSYAGEITATLESITQASDRPIKIECYANTGYALKSVKVKNVVSGAQYYYEPAPEAGVLATLTSFNLPLADDGEAIQIILIMTANVVGIPDILPLTADDDGKFVASVAHTYVPPPGGSSYGDFRVGDEVKLTVTPIQIGSGDATGLAIGAPVFNGLPVIPERAGVDVAATVMLEPGTNTFKVPVYAGFTSSTVNVTEAPTTTWNVDDRLEIGGVTYYRIGTRFTTKVPLESGSGPAYTVVSARISVRSVSTDNYVLTNVLTPVVIDSATRSFSATLRGDTKCEAIYETGTANPQMVFAAFDYGTNSYIDAGVRPTITTTATSPAILSDNIIDTITMTTSPSAAYENAAFLAREEETPSPYLLLPNVNIRVSSAVGARLELWNGTVWIPYTSTIFTMVDAITYFRVGVGDPPEDLVDVKIEVAVDADNTKVQGCVVYVTSGTTLDGNFVIPATIKVRSRTVLYARVRPPAGYVVTGWYVGPGGAVSDETGNWFTSDNLTPGGVSFAVVVPDTGLTLKPRLAPRAVSAGSVMILDADPNNTDEGIWVSKLFRAQMPWKPLAAHVIAYPDNARVTLGIVKKGGEAPEDLNTDDPATITIQTTDGRMRRLPPGRIQKTRFVRYIVSISGEVEVSSVAIGTGTQAMKRGH